MSTGVSWVVVQRASGDTLRFTFLLRGQACKAQDDGEAWLCLVSFLF